MTQKNIFIFIGGLVSGIVLTLVVLFVLAFAQKANGNMNKDYVMFEHPKQTIEVGDLRVMQVVLDGNALAMDYDTYGTIVLVLAKEGDAFYDGQEIAIPSGKCLKQVGTYRYVTRQNVEKTVPVVDFFDK